MFFSLSKDKDSRFSNHNKVGSWWLSHDDGWAQTCQGWAKGYQHTVVDHGSFLEITCNKDLITLVHDRYRSFPLWWAADQKKLTNLLGSGQRIWADDTVKLTDNDIVLGKVQLFDDIKISSYLDVDQVIDAITLNLKNKIQSLTDFTVSKKLFVTGGIDTVMLLALVKSCNVDCDIINYEYFCYDQFTNANLEDIQEQHWGYKQIHHWRNPTMLLSGACGDEFLFRGPYTIGLWAAWYSIDLVKLLSKSTGYHVKYYLQEKNLKVFKEFYDKRNELRKQYPHYIDLIRQILNVNANDHQHWHLGHTLTYTPYKDLELTKIVLQLSPDFLVKQILNAEINQQVIKKIDPECLKLLSDNKNYNSRQHLYRL